MSKGNNNEMEILVNAYLQVSQMPSEEKLQELAQNIVKLMIKILPDEVIPSEKALNLPYKDISDIIFYQDSLLLSNSITEFHGKIENAVSQHEHCTQHSITEDKNAYKQRFMDCHYKIVEHIFLAQIQRTFIQNSINSAIDEKLQAVNKIQEIANQANDTAKKAEETYKSMFANYVTILGIFTAIIVTIFGGLNVITVALKQESFNPSHAIFLTAMAFMCVVSLLYFLANMIMKITGKGGEKLNCLFFGIVIICTLAMGVTSCISSKIVDKNNPYLTQ